MKNIARVLVSVVAIAACPVAALANQLIMDSGGTGGSNAVTVTYVGFNTNYNLEPLPGATGPNGWTAKNSSAVDLTVNSSNGSEPWWTAPIGTSTWVSYEANTQPNGSAQYSSDAGVFEYMSNAFTTTTGEVVQLSVLADNTTAIYLVNASGTFTIAQYPAGYPSTIDGATPDYTTVDNIIIPSSELTATGNVLYFDVSNTAISGQNGSATGLDFELNSLSPEPSSLLLLGTGIVGAAGMVRRRIRA